MKRETVSALSDLLEDVLWRYLHHLQRYREVIFDTFLHKNKSLTQNKISHRDDYKFVLSELLRQIINKGV